MICLSLMIIGWVVDICYYIVDNQQIILETAAQCIPNGIDWVASNTPANVETLPLNQVYEINLSDSNKMIADKFIEIWAIKNANANVSLDPMALFKFYNIVYALWNVPVEVQIPLDI